MCSRNVRLRSDRVLIAPSSDYELGFRGKIVIVPRNEIPLLHIDHESPCSSLLEFWGIVTHDSFDVIHGIQLLTVNFYGPWLRSKVILIKHQTHFICNYVLKTP